LVISTDSHPSLNQQFTKLVIFTGESSSRGWVNTHNYHDFFRANGFQKDKTSPPPYGPAPQGRPLVAYVCFIPIKRKGIDVLLLIVDF
jgi:hypothetical protein